MSQGDFEALVGTTGEPLVEVPQEVENAMLDVCKGNLPESRLQKADIGRLPLEDAQGQVGIPLDETQEGLGGDNAQVHLSGGPSKAGGMTPKGQAKKSPGPNRSTTKIRPRVSRYPSSTNPSLTM